MKNKRKAGSTKNIIICLIGLIIIFLIQSCSQKVAFQTSSVVPAAEGKVKVKKDNNENYTIKVDLTNLSTPDRLEPSMNTYVVWMESNEAHVKNIGQINTSSNFLSDKLKSSFETVSSIKPTKIFITAENDGTVQYPGRQILTTSSF